MFVYMSAVNELCARGGRVRGWCHHGVGGIRPAQVEGWAAHISLSHILDPTRLFVDDDWRGASEKRSGREVGPIQARITKDHLPDVARGWARGWARGRARGRVGMRCSMAVHTLVP